MKKRNEYVRELGELYDKTPKAVWAAVAVSLSTQVNGENSTLIQNILSEWEILYENGIVPQKPLRR